MMNKCYILTTDGRTVGPFENPQDCVRMMNEMESGHRLTVGVTAEGDPPVFTSAPVGLRDQFAMAALTGICANPEYSCDSHARIAEWAYKKADAMLKQRENGSVD